MVNEGNLEVFDIIDIIASIFFLKGGGWFRPGTFGRLILSYELRAMSRKCTNNFRVVLGP